jgi:hypothetical protein
VKVRDITPAEFAKIPWLDPNGVSDEEVQGDLWSMSGNLADATAMASETPEVVAADKATHFKALNSLVARGK